MEHLCSHCTDIHEIWYLSIFRKSVEKIQVWLKSDKNKGYLHKDVCTFTTIYHRIILKLKNVSDKSCRENQNTHFMLNISPKIVSFWDNVETYSWAGKATGDNKVHAYCKLENYAYRHRLKICNIYRFSTATMVTRTRLNVTFRCNCPSCWTSKVSWVAYSV